MHPEFRQRILQLLVDKFDATAEVARLRRDPQARSKLSMTGSSDLIASAAA